MKNVTTYIEQYGLISLEKQDKFERLVGEHTMELDLDSGIIRISGGYDFRFQVLGTESDNTLTWLWAWADEQTEMPSDLLASSLEMKAWGEREEIGDFLTPSVDLDRADGLVFSLIASEVCRASCFYQDTYDGGALYLLLFDRAIDAQLPLDAAGILRQLGHLASLYYLNHRNALLSYLSLHGLPYETSGMALRTRLASGEELLVEFGQDDRVLSVSGKTVADG